MWDKEIKTGLAISSCSPWIYRCQCDKEREQRGMGTHETVP